jgi:pyridoxal phosphate enzyme (YggS family)
MKGIVSETLSANIRGVRQQIVEACQQAGRSSHEVTLVAVTKYVDTPMAVELARCLKQERETWSANSPIVLGENRPQVLQQRWSQWPEDLAVDWHLIGHLQTNKIKMVAGHTALIHSLDRFDLLEKIQDFAAKNSLTIHGLLEFRLSDDADKHGFQASDVAELLDRWPKWTNLRLEGVMGMSGLDANAADARKQFESLRQIHAEIRRQLGPESQTQWRELSMGMSGDLPQAIAAGATMVRIGSALFRGLLT